MLAEAEEKAKNDLALYVAHNCRPQRPVKLKSGGAKENFPVVCVIAAPRQGKSLFLDMVANNLEQLHRTSCCVRISFNSKTQIEMALDTGSLEKVRSAFWIRVLYSLLEMRGVQEELLALRGYSFSKWIDHSFVVRAIAALGFPTGPLIVLADELSKLCDSIKGASFEKDALSSITAVCANGLLVASGFHREFGSRFASTSGRPVEYIHLPLADKVNRAEFSPLKAQLEEQFPTSKLPVALYEWTKLSPGLLGLWLENCLTKPDNKPSSIELLRPPIVQTISAKLETSPHDLATALVAHWRLAANAESGEKARKMLAEVKAFDFYLHTSRNLSEAILNPFLLMHPDLEAQPFGDILQSEVATMFSKDFSEWDATAKGKALEGIIVASLAIRLACINNAMTLKRFISLTCGRCVRTFASTTPANDNCAIVPPVSDGSTPRAVVKAVEAFPCAWSAESFNAGTVPNLLAKRIDEGVQLLRGETAAFKMTESFHAGCDVGALLVLANDERALLLFEARYKSPSSSERFHNNDEAEPSRKAFRTLNCLMAAGGAANKCISENRITRVVFVYCASNRNVDFAETFSKSDTDPEQHSLSALGARWKLTYPECAVSLHALGSSHGDDNDGWKNLLMQSLYYIVPDLNEQADIKK